MTLLHLPFRPKLLDALKGYDRQRLTQDITAGITVGAVALPLAMAFAIASGLKPEAGLLTAILAGFMISALGGSRVQIGGPAGAFIVIVYGIVHDYGLANLILATVLSGVMLFAMGLFRLGTLVRFIPVAVVIGFTNGIAVLIALSQIKDFMGLQIPRMPADFFGILNNLYLHLHTLNWSALALACGSLLTIVLWQTFTARLSLAKPSRLALLPGTIIALVCGTMMSTWFDLPVETIGSRFGGIPVSMPSLMWPEFTWASAKHLLIPTTTLALLGAIESLLCARVADQMIHDRHDPNQELMAQGIANFITPFFGGMPATGTIARTVTNIKSGGSSPVAGMVHALTLVLIMVLAAPLATHVPMATLAAILMFVAWNMGQWREFIQLRQFRLPYRATLLSVFLLTVILDLTVAVEVGLIAACLTFIYRISSLSRVETATAADYPQLQGLTDQVQAYRLYGALFFGAVQLIEHIEDHLPQKVLVLDMKNVIYIDTTGMDALMSLHHACVQARVELWLCGVDHQPREMSVRSGLWRLAQAPRRYRDLSSALIALQAAGGYTS